MTVAQLAEVFSAQIKDVSEEACNRLVADVYLCDLLSWVIGRAQKDSAWITIMSNQNVAAVALLAEVSCVLLAEGVQPDDSLITKAREQDIPVLSIDLPAYEIAKKLAALGV